MNAKQWYQRSTWGSSNGHILTSLFFFLRPPMATTTDSFSVCLMTTMESLWFHQIILIQTDPLANSQLLPPLSDKPASPETSSGSLPQLPQNQTSNTTAQQDEERKAKRPTRLRSHSSSPCTQKQHHLKSLKYSSSSSLSGAKLEKSTSCRTLGELELEEVKGFMDLGFIFKTEDLSSRMMVTLLPGLQRKLHLTGDEDIETEDHDCDGVMRPYLSEAWLIKRPDSPLLNLRVPRMTASCDDVMMKKHLRFWAKTVALVMRHDS